MNYANARILSIEHQPDCNKLIVNFEHHPARTFEAVVDFALTGFYQHNILFGIDEYAIASLPARIAAEYPTLSYYLHSGEEWQIFHLSPQAGLGGVVVCATL